MTSDFAIPYGYLAERGSFPSYTDNRHLVTIGATRSGKGATVIAQALMQVPHSVIVIDSKGQNAAITARRRREMG
jgi:type IV secretion system protein VirD4